jgi:hypothetical protein
MSEENKIFAAVFDASAEDTIEGYNQVMKELEAANADSPEGRLYHVACAKDSGYLVLDVWESRELFDQFSQTLGSVIQKLGGTPGEPQIYPILNIIQG